MAMIHHDTEEEMKIFYLGRSWAGEKLEERIRIGLQRAETQGHQLRASNPPYIPVSG